MTTSNPEEINDAFHRFYQTLYSAESQKNTEVEEEKFPWRIEKKEQLEILNNQIQTQEIQDVIKKAS